MGTRHQLLLSVLAAAAVSGCLAPGEPVSSSTEALRGDPMADDLHRMQRASRGTFHLSIEGGAPTGLVGRFATSGANDEARARGFLAAHPAVFRAAPDTSLVLAQIAEAGPFTRVAFRQRIGGIPVHGAELVVALQGTEVVGVFGRLSAAEIDVEPRLTLAQAFTRSGRAARSPALDGELVVFDEALFDPARRSDPHLAYRVVHDGSAAILDAETGLDLLRSRHEHEAFDIIVRTLKSGSWYDAADENQCLNGPLCMSPWDTITIRNHMRTTHEYFDETHAFDSFNGNGEQISAYSNSSTPTSMQWSLLNGTQYHFLPQHDSVDIVGHEFTHGIIGNTSGLDYVWQTGALNEAIADLFGNLVEGGIDLVGENSTGGAIRSLCNPSTYSWDPPGSIGPLAIPDHMNEYVTYPPGVDNGGVHFNSGVAGRAFCDMATRFGDGDPNTDYALGVMGRVAFVANQLLPSNATFATMRDAMVLVALSEPSPAGEPFHVACQVVQGWQSVGVNGADDFSGVIDSICTGAAYADGDNDYIPDADDNCNDVSNASQDDFDGDGIGDACETDYDGDGYADYYDNCWKVPGSQLDADADGIGDICDDDTTPSWMEEEAEVDSDGDTVFGATDNCPFTPNAGQADGDADGLGDACDPCPLDAIAPDGWSQGIPELDLPPKPIFEDSDGDGLPNACDPYIFSAAGVTVDGSASVPVYADAAAHAIAVEGASIPAKLNVETCTRRGCARGPLELRVSGLPLGARVAVATERGQALGALTRDGAIRFIPRGRVRIYVQSARRAALRVSLTAVR